MDFNYIGCALDRTSGKPVIVASKDGRVDMFDEHEAFDLLDHASHRAMVEITNAIGKLQSHVENNVPLKSIDSAHDLTGAASTFEPSRTTQLGASPFRYQQAQLT